MSQYEITKSIKMPHGNGTYPFDKMEPGDSFPVSVEERTKVSSSANMYGARNNKKFSVRKYEGAYRCWRKS